MPRTARASRGGVCHHVMSRANRREVVFHDATDYMAFEDSMRRACDRLSMRILAWCLMPTHFHLVLNPYDDGDLGRWMHRLLTRHVQRHRRRYDTEGRIWQGRFKAPPIQQDNHLLTVLRYVERNPLRAGLVKRAEDWPWSSLPRRIYALPDDLLSPSPVPLPENWIDFVNQPLTASELEEVRRCTRREIPYGDPAWTKGTAERLTLNAAPRRRGRPRAWEPCRRT